MTIAFKKLPISYWLTRRKEGLVRNFSSSSSLVLAFEHCTKIKMGSEIPMVQPIFQSSKRSQMELSKSLAILGFGSWNELEPGK